MSTTKEHGPALGGIEELLFEGELSSDHYQRLIGAYGLFTIGREIQSNDYLFRSVVSRRELSLASKVDVLQLEAGRPLTRHQWFNDVSENSTRHDFLRAMSARVAELEAAEEQDDEMIHATIEVGGRATMTPDEHGNPFLNGVYVYSPEASPARFAGVPIEYGSFVQGCELWPDDVTRRNQWHIRSNAAGPVYLVPVAAISYVESMWDDKGEIRAAA